MRLRKVLFPLASVASLSSLAMLSYINETNEEANEVNKNNVLTFHFLPEEFYNLTKNITIQRTISLDKNDLLLADYETVWMPFKTYKIDVYYDMGYINTYKIYDNINKHWQRDIQRRYSSSIENDNEVKNSPQEMYWNKFEIKKETNYKKINATNYDTFKNKEKVVIRNSEISKKTLNKDEVKNLLTSEMTIIPHVEKGSNYGIAYSGVGNHIIYVYFEHKRYDANNFEENLLNTLIERAKAKVGEDEELITNNVSLNRDFKVEFKQYFKEYLKNNGNEIIETGIKEYEPGMIIENLVSKNIETNDGAEDFLNNFGLKLQIYAPDIKFNVVNTKNAKAAEIVDRYEKAFSKAQSLIRNTNSLALTNENIAERTLYSIENQRLLREKIAQINEKLVEYDFFIDYQIISENKIDLFLSNKTNTYIDKSYKLASNFPIKVSPSVKAVDGDIQKRLVIKANKWVDFQTNSTELVDDVPVLLEKQKKLSDKSFYGGKWLYHSPASVDFQTIDESEVLFINNKRIEVLDRHFSEILTNEEKAIVNANDKEEENKIRAYEIKILKFEKGSANVEEKLEYEYKIDILINSNAMSIDYKFYAWEPENNEEQKKLIEEFKKDSSGNILKDADGRPIKNEFYDAEIDKNTGTKKQLVWVDLTANTEILSSDKYTVESALPYGTKTLLLKNGSQLIKGFIAEAAVLGSGALQILNGELTNSQYRLFKLNKEELIYNDSIKYERLDNGLKYKDLVVASSENSYFSDSGLYLFTSHAPSSIDNYKFVLIDKNLNAQKNKFVETINGLSRIKSFWESPVGVEFLKYLKVKHNISNDVAMKFSYELVMQYFVLFTNYVFKLQYYTQNSKKYISAYFNNIPRVYSYEAFKNRYILSENGFDLFFNDYAGNFDNKELVKINNIQISSDKRNLIIDLNLKYSREKNIFTYELSESRITLPVSFTDNDVEESFAENISFSLNEEHIENVLLETEISEWERLLITKNWINEIDNETFDKAFWYLKKVKINEETYRIDISGVIKKEYERDLRIAPKTKSMNVNLNKKMVNFEKDNWEIRLTNSSINLAGINEESKIKSFVERKVNELLADLANYKEYNLENINEIAPYLVNVNLSTDSPLFYKILNLRRLKDNKLFKIPIYNYVEHKYNKQFDLSLIPAEMLTINSNNEVEIIELINKKIEIILAKYNIVSSDISLINIEDVLHNLLHNNKINKLIVASNHYQLINTFTLNIKNEYKHNLAISKENERALNKRVMIDLSKLNVPKLELNNIRTFKDLQNEIITYITNYLASYDIYLNFDYYIENINSPAFLVQLVRDLENEASFKVKALKRKAINETSFVVKNTLLSPLTEEEKRAWEKAINEFLNKVNKEKEANNSADNNNNNSNNGNSNNDNNNSNKTNEKWSWDKDIESFINGNEETNYGDKNGLNLINENDLSTIINAKLVDLSKLKIETLRTYYDSNEDLADAILKHIESNLDVKYTINQSEFNSSLRKLLIANKENTQTILIRGLYGYSKGILTLKVINITSKSAEFTKEITIKSKVNIIKDIENKKIEDAKKAKKKQNIWIGLSVGFLVLTAGISGFIIWIRKFKNKIK